MRLGGGGGVQSESTMFEALFSARLGHFPGRGKGGGPQSKHFAALFCSKGSDVMFVCLCRRFIDFPLKVFWIFFLPINFFLVNTYLAIFLKVNFKYKQKCVEDDLSCSSSPMTTVQATVQ